MITPLYIFLFFRAVWYIATRIQKRKKRTLRDYTDETLQ